MKSMHKGYCVIGSGYLGLITAAQMEKTDHQLTITTRSYPKSEQLAGIGSYQRVLKLGDGNAYMDWLLNMDGICICIAPTSSADTYQKVFGDAIDELVEFLKVRNAIRPLHITFISSSSTYGDAGGAVVDEDHRIDHQHVNGQLLSQAEQKLLALENGNTVVCVLRLGGLTGPGRDMRKFFTSNAGEEVQLVGDHALAFTHVVDAARAVGFAYENKLSGIYNVCMDDQMTRRELGSAISDEDGLAPILWTGQVQPNLRYPNAKVSNQKIKDAGFEFRYPSLVSTAGLKVGR
jgi:nucleoside-diphosphate-sugar epimerase